ncbi:MAG TPA: AMP-binding protein [Candidatus Acidoferrum sp.]|nr:AMP-binding protein [Candidatus Acidoferrum sp.]
MNSYSRGADLPLLELTISDVLARNASTFAERDALIVCHQQARLNWQQLDREATRVAAGLAALGLAPGDRVGIWATNCLEWVLLQFGSARAGVVLVNVNPAYRSHELGFVLQRSRIRALFLHACDTRTDYRAILAECAPPEHVVWLGEPSWDAMLAAGDPAWTAPPVSATEVVNIEYTSGTTGSPKGVLLTHRNIVNNGLMIAHALHASERDRICSPVPMYHCFGCVIGSMVSLVTGAAMILPSRQFDPRAALEAIEQERATVIYGVPTMFIAELEHPEFDRFDLTSLRTGIMAGATCPIEVMRRVCDRMHCSEMTIGYGQTEASPIITMSRADDSLETRVSTIGAAMPNTEVKIIDPVTCEIVPLDQTGELCTRGYLVMQGYDEEPEATARSVDCEGWLRTGDLASMRADGNVIFRGRAKDIIIRGGENIYPREIEDFLHTHPKIADVYVFGLPDRRLGEIPMAWVQLNHDCEASEEEIREFCRDRIAYFKVPQHVRFVDSFPMTVTRKVQKFVMRRQEVQERGLTELEPGAAAEPLSPPES